VKKKPEENENKETEKKPKEFHNEEEADSGSPAPVGNGGKTDRYVWTQTLYEVEMKIKIPADVYKKDLDISFQENKIRAKLKKKQMKYYLKVNQMVLLILLKHHGHWIKNMVQH